MSFTFSHEKITTDRRECVPGSKRFNDDWLHIGCFQGGTGETDTKLAFFNTPTFPVFSPPTYFNQAFILRFYLSFILLLSTALYILFLLFYQMQTCNKPISLTC